MSLEQQVKKGIKWTTASTVIVTVFQLLQLAILARFLQPGDFGLMAIVTVIIGFSQAFFDMGMSNAIIHKQEINHEQLSTLYWVNILAGFALFLIVILVAPLAVYFYQEPELNELIRLVALIFLMQPFGQMFMVLFQKNFQFSTIGIINISSKFFSLLVSVFFAYKGHGVYSLVYGTLGNQIVQTILYLILGMRDTKPSLIFKPKEISGFLSFGAYQMGERTINYFNSQADIILIGRLLGSEALGIYSIAKQLIMYPAQVINPIVTKVTFPTLAKVQNNDELLKKIYLKTINYLSSINFPIYSLILIFASDIVITLFGEKWVSAITIVQILCIYGALRSAGNPVGTLLLAKGRAKLGFYWNLGLLFYFPAGIYIASFYDLRGIAWGLVIMSIIAMWPSWIYLIKPLCDAKFKDYHYQIFRPVVFSAIFLFSGYLIKIFFPTSVVYLPTVTIIGVIIFSTFNYIFNKDFLITLLDFRK